MEAEEALAVQALKLALSNMLCTSGHMQSHYDDADRFQQPIFSLRLFSDSRLSFGTQLYG
jgi:hypothetical protein